MATVTSTGVPPADVLKALPWKPKVYNFQKQQKRIYQATYSKKVGLKLNIQKTKIMASGHINSWQIDGETVETVADSIFLAPKSLQMVTAAMKLKDAYSSERTL